MRRPLLTILLPLGGMLAVALFTGQQSNPNPALAQGEDVVPGRYIVVLEDSSDTQGEVSDLEDEHRFKADVVYTSAIDGFAADLTNSEVQSLADDPSVRSIEPDHIVRTSLHQNNFQSIPTGVDRIDAEAELAAGIGGQSGPDVDIDVAVIDTGIDVDHPELNVAGGVRFTGGSCSGSSYDDDNGHGTHVSGTIAARDDDRGAVGVAPGARLWAVKVLDQNGSGSDSCVIEGIDWVADRRAEFNDGAGDGDPGINIAVANMSLGGPGSSALCTAVSNAVAKGVMIAVAAGNSAMDAANTGPANCAAAITVSAYADFDGLSGGLLDGYSVFGICTETEDDSFACFSSYGAVVDIAAPGVDIISTYPGGLYSIMSGTSMATPHMSGALALLKANGYNGSADGAAVMSALTGEGWARPQTNSCGFDGDPDNSHEPVLYLGAGCTGTGSPTSTPTPSPTATPGPSGSATPSPTPTSCPGDLDCDAWTDAREAFLGTASALACPATATKDDEPVDAWPPDFNDDRIITIPDALRFNPVFGQGIAQQGYNARFDLNASGLINMSDVLALNAIFGTTCG